MHRLQINLTDKQNAYMQKKSNDTELTIAELFRRFMDEMMDRDRDAGYLSDEQ